MRKIFIATVVCIYITGLCILGCCQGDNTIEQSESQIGQNLDSEISSEQAEGKAEEQEADTEFEEGEPIAP